MTKLLIYSLVAWFSVSLFAASEFVPMQEKAQGQSMAGSSVLNDSIFSNPAGSAFVQAYQLEGNFLPPKTFAVSVLDTKTSTIVGGIGYFRKEVPGSTTTLQGLRLAMSGRVSEVVGIGAAGKMVWGPSGSATNGSMKDIDVGMLANLGTFQVGSTIRNSLGGNAAMAMEREIAVGGRAGWNQTLYLSVATQSLLSAIKPYQYGIGAEYVTPYYVSVKGGYRTLPYEAKSFWSVGASFLSPTLSLHYACEIPTFVRNQLDHQLGASLMF